MAVLRSRLSGHQPEDGSREERQPAHSRREPVLIAVAVVFVFVNALAFSAVREGSIDLRHLWAPLVWLVAIVGASLAIGRLRPHRDPYLLPVFALLAGWGLLLQDRLAPNFLGRQTLWFLLATATAVALAVLPRSLQPLMRYRYILLIGGLAALGMTLLFGANPSGAGAALWLPIPVPLLGTIYLQPSEPLKLLLVIFLASYFTEQEPLYHHRRATSRHGGHEPLRGPSAWISRHAPFLGPLLLMWGFCLLLLVWQQDLGAATLFFVIFIGLLYLSTGDLGYVAGGLLLLLLAAILAYFIFDSVVAPRLLSWLNPWPNVSDRAYQIAQALYAQASGGILGRGIGQGFPDYIPVVHSDFAMAAIAEEWGLIGSLSVVMCYALLAQRGLRVALLSIQGPRPRFFYAYLAAGIAVLFTTQALLIMGGVTKLLPLTGVTLPLVSYGGSSLLVSGAMFGLLLFLSADVGDQSLARAYDEPLAKRLERLCAVILLSFGLVSLALAYWSTWRSETLASRADNPRLVEAELRVQRGRILDRRDVVLAETVGVAGQLRRQYPSPESHPAVGYYSLRHGASGVEQAYDSLLRGASEDGWEAAGQRLLNRYPRGADVRLTLDANLQKTADRLLSAETGALVLMELNPSEEQDIADVRVMASQPGYDPNQLDESYEVLAATDPGRLFNRAAQGLYQPGLMLQPLLLAAAADDRLVTLDDAVLDPQNPIPVNGQVRRCESRVAPDNSQAFTWRDMLVLRCAAPAAELGRQLGVAALADYWQKLIPGTSNDLPILTSTAPDPSVSDAGLSAIGQDELTVTPLQLSLAYATLAGGGRQWWPRLVEGTIDPEGNRQSEPRSNHPRHAILTSTKAEAVRAALPNYGNITETAVTVISGPEGEKGSWYVGMAPANAPRFVAVVMLENESDLSRAEEIGRHLLTEALSAP